MSKKNPPIDFTKEYENPLEEIKDRMMVSMAKSDKSNHRFQIFMRVMVVVALIFLLSTVSYAIYDGINNYRMKVEGREFCLASGYVYGDSSCVEKLSDGSVRVHEINYAEKQWNFVKE